MIFVQMSIDTSARSSASAEQVASTAEAYALSLSGPYKRCIPKQLNQPQPLRLAPVQDRFHNVGRQAGERQEPTDVGHRHALLLGEVGDRLRPAALDPAPPPGARAPAP